MKKIILGLGNPGPRYVFTKHNVGFLSIDRYYEINKKIADFRKISGRTFEGYETGNLVLIKPTTFMNLSGQVFSELFRKYGKTDINDIIVIYDDISIDFGKIRIRADGSAGGHNGMKSVIGALNSDKFPRIRIGIDKKPEFMDLADYVLSSFTNDETYNLYKVLDQVCNSVDDIISMGVESAMNKYNGKNFL
ncbi:MAG: aminoacyl-tRNA hydrolase [Thermotogae bacterium]|nr:aminoacyl-tRNA hydrolase [Thermotogota bacterium]MCP5465158.1 aminoacyl-tRNA hydrolase [Thermotogota bacterium]HOO75273.1 aminoacyl-tRNA hydrolase [Tepiditoga sp.]